MTDETSFEKAKATTGTDPLHDAERDILDLQNQGWVWRGEGIDKVLSHPDDPDLNIWFHPYSGEQLLSPKLVQRIGAGDFNR